jgi:enediyne biosynthesis protein E4
MTAPQHSEANPSPQSALASATASGNDVVIARAFRWSLIFLVLLVIGILGITWIIKRRPAVVYQPVKPLTAPLVPRHEAKAQVPPVRFVELGSASGLDFIHHNGAYGQKLLPETMGGGVAFLDANNDGQIDLLFVSGTDWAWHNPAAKTTSSLRLYLNDGHGQFLERTRASGLDLQFYGMGVAVGDYDNDGWVDIYISGIGGGRLFHNEGDGQFIETTAAAAVAGAPDDWSTACAWFDYDKDGRLDLFVGNYVKWSKEIDLEVGYKLVGVGRAYGQPLNFEGAFPHLYHNEGQGRFVEVTDAAGLRIRNPSTGVPAAKTLGVAVVDLDNDGWLDLVLANDTVPNFVFHNQGNGAFREIGAVSGVAFDPYGNTRGAMGIDTAYYRNNRNLGIVIGNFANEMTALYVAQSDPLLFVDEAITEGIGPASRLALKFGQLFLDYDLDGWLDVLSCNGHIEDEIGKIQQSQTYAQSAQLFWNCGRATGPGFVPVTSGDAGGDLFKPIVGRGCAYADLEGDGDLDVILTQIAGPPLLLRNDLPRNNHWLRLKLTGTKSNRDAIGARLWLKAGGRVLPREVNPTRGYLSQSELVVTFGLGSSTQVDEVEIRWPSGARQIIKPEGIDRLLTVVEPESE